MALISETFALHLIFEGGENDPLLKGRIALTFFSHAISEMYNWQHANLRGQGPHGPSLQDHLWSDFAPVHA